MVVKFLDFRFRLLKSRSRFYWVTGVSRTVSHSWISKPKTPLRWTVKCKKRKMYLDSFVWHHTNTNGNGSFLRFIKFCAKCQTAECIWSFKSILSRAFFLHFLLIALQIVAETEVKSSKHIITPLEPFHVPYWFPCRFDMFWSRAHLKWTFSSR